MQKTQSVNWKKTLNNIIWNHKYNDVIFSVKEIEDLHNYIQRLQIKNEAIQEKVEALEEKNALLHSKCLKTALKQTPQYDVGSRYYQYA